MPCRPHPCCCARLQPPREGELFAALKEEAFAVWGQAMADPAAVAARTAWGACLLDAGYPRFVERFDAQNWINGQVNALQAF